VTNKDPSPRFDLARIRQVEALSTFLITCKPRRKQLQPIFAGKKPDDFEKQREKFRGACFRRKKTDNTGNRSENTCSRISRRKKSRQLRKTVREIQERLFSSQKKLITPETGAKTPAADFLAGKKAENFEKRCEKFRSACFRRKKS
jgi:hypothetical protein